VPQLLSPQDAKLVERLRMGDEEAFMDLIEELNPSLLRVARMYVPTTALAEDVVQETWLAVFNSIDRFEGRSSLKTWIFRILTNIAKTRGERERRSVPFSTFDTEDGGFEPAVERSRFTGTGHWAVLPRAWPEDRLLASETLSVIERAIAQLPPSQQAVITLRDVDGWSAEEVRNALDLSETNQRVLLHRARSKVRRTLEQYLSEEQ
jgi:RNA polymerase sigma-70 factor (ECF subfamily)